MTRWRHVGGLVGCVVAGLSACAHRGPSAGGTAEETLNQSPRHHEWVDIETDAGRTVRAYVVFPEVDRAVGAIVVIHENRGLNDWARSLADQVAEAGYVAVAPDLLSGSGPDGGGTESFSSPDDARKGIYDLLPAQVLSDLDAAVAYARGLEATADKVAVAGFCWGGAQTFRYATHGADIAAAFVFYGQSVTDADAIRNIRSPVYGFYGGNDHRITSEVPRTRDLMSEAGKTYEPVVYEGAGHGFMRSGEGPEASVADQEARARAWGRWKALLAGL